MKHSHQYTDELRLKDNQNLSWNKLLYLVDYLILHLRKCKTTGKYFHANEN